MMSEGGLKAPTRHAVPWREADYTDAAKLDAETRRVFDVCHGCRRCFNLCDSFPRLFDLIDESPSGELDSVASTSFDSVAAACTLCDMCFMTKCPYVPPHSFGIDFPHLMLRHRAAAKRRGEVGWFDRVLAKTDRNGGMARFMAPLVNWATARGNRLTRPLMERFAGLHRDAVLPRFHRRTLVSRATPEADRSAPAAGRKAVLFATCFANYNNPRLGLAAVAVLARNGVETTTVYPGCCGMPLLELGDVEAVAARARAAVEALVPWLDKGHEVVVPVPSCALMLKFEWPLILPDEAPIRRLADAARDVCEYVVDIARNEGLADGLGALPGGVALHLACHARAQNMGAKAAEMLRLIPGADLTVIKRCSGHGGSWGVKKENFEVALKVGRPVARQAAGKPLVASECPLAGAHIVQGLENLDGGAAVGGGAPAEAHHPIELFARAYGIEV